MKIKAETLEIDDKDYADTILDSVFKERDPNKDEIYVALSGTDFEIDTYDFGQGITLQKTYAFIFAPYLASFKTPNKPGGPNPGPWKVVKRMPTKQLVNIADSRAVSRNSYEG